MKKGILIVLVLMLAIVTIFFIMRSPGQEATPAQTNEQPEGAQDIAGNVVRISALTDYPPFIFEKGTQEYITSERIEPGSDSAIVQGYSWDIVREAYHNQGYTIELTVAPWARALGYMEAHQTDLLLATTYTEERGEKYYYSDENNHRIDIVIYVPEDSSFAWTELESIYGKKIGVIREYSYGDVFGNAVASGNIETQAVDSPEQGFALIDSGRVFGFIGMKQVHDYFLEQNGLAEKYKTLPPIQSNPENMAGMQSNPRVPELLAAYDEGKRALIANGTFAAIGEKWGISY